MNTFTVDAFSGGLCTDKSPKKVRADEALDLRNVYWNGELTTVKGRTLYTEDLPGAVVGAIRGFLVEDQWYTFLAVDDDTDVRFFYGETTFTEIDASFTATRGRGYKFVQFGNRIVGVNGLDYPVVIYREDEIVKIIDLQHLDEQVRDNVYWYAGNFDGVYYSDNTEAAQSTGTFYVFNQPTDSGMFVAGDIVFNKVVFHNVTVTSAPASVVYEYWNGESWEDMTSLLVTTPDFTTEGETILEFDVPIEDWALLWKPCNLLGAPDSVMLHDKYVVRITTPTSETIVSASNLVLSNTQYIRQITGGIPPQAIGLYSGRVWLATKSVAYASPYNSLTGWAAYNIEVFEEGGETIEAIVGFEDFMLVFKRAAIYGLSGNSYQNFNKRKLVDVGTRYPRSVVTLGNYAFFLGSDGYVYAFSSGMTIRISKHIHSQIQHELPSEPVGFVEDGRYHLAFPTGAIYTFDPDTFKQDEMGDGVVSWFRFTGRIIDHFLDCSGSNDHGYKLSIDGPDVFREFHGEDIEIDSVDSLDIRTRYKTSLLYPGEGGKEKVFRRLKVSVKPDGIYEIVVRNNDSINNVVEPDYVQAEEPEDPAELEQWVRTDNWMLYMYDGEEWVVVTDAFYYRFDSGDNGAIYEEEVSLPYYMDEQGISFEIRHIGVNGKLFALYFESDERHF